MKTLLLKDKLFCIDKPIVMGVVNITKDSFFANSRAQSEKEILHKVEKHISEGAHIIDIGAQSTRPGAEMKNEKDELEQIVLALKLIKKHFKIPVSVDTFHSEIAKITIEEGADLINDVSGGQQDSEMFKVLSQKKIPFICGHLKGDITEMLSKKNTTYKNIVLEIAEYFKQKKELALQHGIHDIIFDIGFGFSKLMKDNYLLIKNLEVFKTLFDNILMVGVSRKSSIFKLLDIKPEEALNGTTVLHSLALLNGADILRVHDVKEAIETVKIIEYYKSIQ